MKYKILPILVLAMALAGCDRARDLYLLTSHEITLSDASPVDTTVTEVTAHSDSQGRAANILSAFYGLDDDLPPLSGFAICENAGRKDGMPVVFSHTIDFETMQAGDFKVTTKSGKVGEILCVTLAPADDLDEYRTVLVVGHYGSIDDQPVRVEIVGNLLSQDNSLNFKGLSAEVTPLEAGPSLVLAQIVPAEQWDLEKTASPLPFGGGSGCPINTQQVLRVTWDGGVTKPGGAEIDDKERQLYQVAVMQENGHKTEISPFALGDLGDGDNNHELCMDVVGTPVSVSFPAGYLTDPREDLNPDTAVEITGS